MALAVMLLPFLVSASSPEVKPPGAQVEPQEKQEMKISCPDCSSVEQQILSFFQKRGIEDKNSLAVILGNIKQESKFNTKVCEGGRSTGYHGCRRGGFGLLQWTTSGRYYGLGRHANSKGLNPDSLEAQLSWMVTEVEWKRIEHKLKQPGNSVQYYMNVAFSWIGWGVHGARTHYSFQYLNLFK